MRTHIIQTLTLIVCLVAIPLHADDDDQQKISDFITGLKNLPATVKDVGTGLAQSFGAPLGSQYKKSYVFYNDTPYQLYAATRPLVYLQGATIVSASGINQDMLIPPYQNSGVSFYNTQMRFDMLVDYDSSMNNNKSSYKSKIDNAAKSSKSGDVTLMIRSEIYQTDPSAAGFHDPYFIRAYMQHGNIGVEFLSQAVTSSQFVGVFYNNTDNPVKLNFIKDAATYNVTLDPHSFNNLESSLKDYSIRPSPTQGTKRSFTFTINSKTTSIGIDPQGIVGGPYTYEIYKGQVNVQGINIGNFDSIPLDAQGNKAASRIRDINPVPCSFWVRSSDQMNTDSQSTSKTTYTNETFPYWLLYKSQDQTLIKKLSVGKVNDTFIVRPQLAEQEAWVYVVVPMSQDKNQIDTFLKRIMDGTITVSKNSLTLKEDTVTTLDVNTHCIIDDTVAGGSGIQGYFLLADVFLPLGIGATPLFYTFDASIIGTDELASLISSYLNPNLFATTNQTTSVDQLMTNDLKQNVPLWINEYLSTKTNRQFVQYMQSKGADRLFSNPKDSANQRKFNDTGQQVINQLTTGQVSIANYPVLRSTGTNNFTTQPDGMDKITHVQL